MKKVLFSLALVCVALAARTQSAVYTMKAVGGDTLSVSYHSAVVPSVVLYCYDTLYRWHVYEFRLDRGGGMGGSRFGDTALSRFGDTAAWTARIPLPPATGFVAYKFIAGDSVDNNNDIGYFTMVYREDGRYMPGAEAGYGLIRSPGYGMGVPGYFKNFTISDTATYMWTSNEILRQQGAAPAALALPYLHAGRKAFPERGLGEARRAVRYLLLLSAARSGGSLGRDSAGGSGVGGSAGVGSGAGSTGGSASGVSASSGAGEEPLVKAWLICRDILKDTVRMDSIRGALLTAYPAGAFARMEAYSRLAKAHTMEDRLSLSKLFIGKFPFHDEDVAINQLLGIDYYTVYRMACSIAIANKDQEIVLEYKNSLPFENVLDVYYKAVEIPYDDWKSVDASKILPYSEALYQRMLYYYDHQPARQWYYSPSEWKAYCEKAFSHYFRLHARILSEVGRDEEALALARRARVIYAYSSSDLNQTEALLLERGGAGAELDTLLYASVHVNQVTPSMIGMLRRKFKGSDDAFDAWLESMKDDKTRQLMKEEISKERLSIPAPAFSLRDSKGRKVTLSQLKGKIVVLDFWATWCAPCKAGMAGMNMALKRYGKDTGVVFYFIDTQEHTPGYKDKAKAFLGEKGYDFNILFDAGEKMDTAYSAYAKALHTSGIPFKAVIDARGVLRYANIGYKGSPSGLSDEIGVMIELARGGGMERGVSDKVEVRSDKVGIRSDKAGGTSDKVPYRSDSVFYDNLKDSIHIGATLTYPANGQAKTAVVLLSGTGRQDRDGTMAGHKLFAFIADSLTRRGFAVLRSDDRGVGQTNGNYEQATTNDFADDAIAAVDYLRGRKDLHLVNIGLLGHSEGGMAAGIAAAKDNRIAFVITLSAPGKTGLEALLLQNRQIVHQAQIPEVNKMRFDSINHLLFTVVYRNAGAPDLERLLRNAYAQWKVWDDSVVAANKLEYGGHFFFPLETYIRQATGAWYQGFITYDPGKVLPRVHVPWLAINGDRDIISDGVTNLKGIADYLAKGGNRQVTTWLVPGLNHLYQHCKTCDLGEYAGLRETMAVEVVMRIGEWLAEREKYWTII